MKKKSLFAVIAIVIIIALLSTWIFPVSYYQYSLVEGTREQVGIFELLGYGSTVMQYFGWPIFYILAIGGFYGVMTSIGGYRKMLDKVANLFKDKGWLCLLSMIIVLTLITSFAGLSTALLFVFPLFVQIILLLGYDKVTAAMVTAGSVLVGLVGTTIGYTTTSIFSAILEVETTALWGAKAIIFVLVLALLIFIVLKYAKSHKLNDAEKNEMIANYVPSASEGKNRMWPVIVIIDLMILAIIVSQINWEQMFGVTLFTKITEKLITFEIAGFPIFGKLLSTSLVSIGSWTLTELTTVVLVGAAFISLCHLKKPSTFINSFWDGVKKAFRPAALVFALYIVVVITALHPTLLTIFKPLLEATNGLNVFTMSLVAFVTSVFNVETYYTAASTLPYVMSIITDTTTYPTIALIWQSMYGLAMLVAPTSIILVATLAYLDIPYGKWLKAIWKLALGILIILLAVFTVLILI